MKKLFVLKNRKIVIIAAVLIVCAAMTAVGLSLPREGDEPSTGESSTNVKYHGLFFTISGELKHEAGEDNIEYYKTYDSNGDTDRMLMLGYNELGTSIEFDDVIKGIESTDGIVGSVAHEGTTILDMPSENISYTQDVGGETRDIVGVLIKTSDETFVTMFYSSQDGSRLEFDDIVDSIGIDGSYIDESTTDASSKIATTTTPTTTEPTTKSRTMGELNALDKAWDYLDYSAFSRKGLIDQLEYEGFSKSEAEYAVDNCLADWNEQAAQKAQEYIDYDSFSKQGLIDQLEYEGFTSKQAKYGAKAVGY